MNWKIKEEHLEHEFVGKQESIFSLANGKIGVRGFHQESVHPRFDASIYMNGFYDTEDFIYGEAAYGFAKKMQKMLPLPDVLSFEIICDGEMLNLETSEIEGYLRTLDLQRGVLTKQYTWVVNNKHIHIEQQMIVSMAEENVVVSHWNFATDTPCEIKIIHRIEAAATRTDNKAFDPRLGSLKKQTALHLQNQLLQEKLGQTLVQYETDESGLLLTIGQQIVTESGLIETHDVNRLVQVLELSATPQNLTIFGYYSDKLIGLEEHSTHLSELVSHGFDDLYQKQENIVKKFWETQELSIAGNEELLKALRFNVFSLFQHVGKDGKTNICAKGLSGEGYDGHYFWDTEIYVLPFFIYTNPKIAKSLLQSRIAMLESSMKRAQEMSYKGAMYAWRTINGEEASAYYPAGTAQIHINADIAYATYQYYQATLDDDFIRQEALPMLIEIARFYADYADFVPEKGWCINGVTGPDEYHTMTNNNAYTNLMVRKQFVNLLQMLIDVGDTSVATKEQQHWKAIADGLYIKKEGLLTAQDEQFFERLPWDDEKRPLRPLLLHYHPMVIYKHQVLKQADLILAMLLSHEDFTLEEQKANYTYYEPLTTHDSSLSETIHGIIAAHIGREEEAYQYFYDTVVTDLHNTHNNTDVGIHIAAMAGGWQSLVYGFGGMRVYKDRITFSPKTAKDLQSYSFSILFRGVKISVSVLNGQASLMQEQEIPHIKVELV